MEIKSINPKKKQKEIAKELGYSTSTLQRYRNDIKMQSHYKSNNRKRSSKTSNDLKRPQMTSNDENDKHVSIKYHKIIQEVVIQMMKILLLEGILLNKPFLPNKWPSLSEF